MRDSKPWIPLLAGILLTSMLACVIPGLTPASLPAPTADTDLLATVVAVTVSAALAETATAMPTPTPVPTATATVAPTQTPSAGSVLTKQADGSTHFGDQLAGYEAIVPTGWLAVRINEQEYFDAFTLAETADPAIQRSLSGIENQDPNQFRLFAFDTQAGHVQSGFVTNVNFLWEELDEMSLSDETDLVAASGVLTSSIPGIEVQTTELTRTAAGIPIGVITSRSTVTTADAVQVVIFQKQVFIKPEMGTLVITLSTTEALSDTVLPAFDAMIETISILN